MLKKIAAMIARIRWSPADIAQFAGRYLSDPKPNVFFDAPEQELSLSAFGKLANRFGVALDAKTRMLFTGEHFFINGETFNPDGHEVEQLTTLADKRRVEAPLSKGLIQRLHGWYQAGWIVIKEA